MNSTPSPAPPATAGGRNLPTLEEVAARAGVSRATKPVTSTAPARSGSSVPSCCLRPGRSLATGYAPEQSIIMAGTLYGTVPVLIVFALLSRQIVGGIMQGAVKG
ncbi:MAG TPA: hypothetical protein VF612_16810 [Jatrophihabitans sp.]